MNTRTARKKPVFLIAFADYRTEAQHLRQLGKEHQAIKEALEGGVAKELCAFDIIPDATVPEILLRIEKYGDQLVGFHFAGHADGLRLMLSSAQDGQRENVYAEGFGPALARLAPKLQFVFLNGCSTRQQAQHFLQNQVPLVIATETDINDTVARQFAAHFYQRLIAGASVEEAVRSYQHIHEVRASPVEELYHRGVGRSTAKQSFFPWTLYPEDGSQKAKDWSLPKAIGNCLFFLPELPASIGWPTLPYKQIQSYQYEDARIFFGRSCEIKALYEHITEPALDHRPLILVYGQSGVGKTSFLKAGLQPRIEEHYLCHYLFPAPSQGLTAALHGFLEPETGESVPKAWHRKVEEAAMPICLIVDQLEEAIMHPSGSATQELQHFMQTINTLLRTIGASGSRILFSFREDYLADLEHLLYEHTSIRPTKRHIRRLSIQGITEAITGPQHHYDFALEEGLPEKIAQDLAEDQHSAIGPVLQILMSRLWVQQNKEAHGPAIISRKTYVDLKKKAQIIPSFLDEGLKDIQRNFPREIDDGLVLDLLNWHTSNSFTSRARPRQDILHRYSHIDPGRMSSLLNALVDSYILSSTAAQPGDELASTPADRHYRLSHDVIAPVIRQRFQDSACPGQQAYRILKNKYASPATEIHFNKEELQRIDQGRYGMQTLSQEQLVHLSNSRAIHRQQTRRRKLLLSLTIISVLALFTMSGSYWQLNQQKISDSAIRKGSILAEQDPTAALPYFRKGMTVDQDNPLKEAQIGQILSDQLLYQQMKTGLDDTIQRMAIASDGQQMVVGFLADHQYDLVLLKRESAQRFSKNKVFREPSARMDEIVFSSDGQYVLAGGADHVLHLWHAQDEGRYRTYRLEKDSTANLLHIAISGDNEWLAASDNEKKLSIWQRNSEAVLPLATISTTTMKEVNHLAFHPLTPTQLWLATASGTWACDLPDKGCKLVASQRSDQLCFSPDGQVLLSLAGKQIFIHHSERDGNSLSPLISSQHEIEHLAYTADGKMLYTSGAREGQLWDLQGPQRAILRGKGHRAAIEYLYFDNVLKQFISLDQQGAVYSWEVPYPYPVRIDTLNNRSIHIKTVCFLPAVEKLLTGTDLSLAYYDWFDSKGWPVTTGHSFEDLPYPQVRTLAGSNTAFALIAEARTNKVSIWDTDANKEVASLPAPAATTILGGAFSADGQMAGCYLTSEDSSAILWEWQKDQLIHLISPHGRMTNMAISQKATDVLTAHEGGIAVLWDGKSGELLDTFPHRDETIINLGFFPDVKSCWVATASGKLFRWSTGRGQSEPWLIADNNIATRQVKQSPDGLLFFQHTAQGALFALDPNGILLQQFRDAEDLLDFTYKEEQAVIIGGNKNGLLKYWHIARKDLVTLLEGPVAGE